MTSPPPPGVATAEAPDSGQPRAVERTGRAATLVATGIFLSRIAGLIRESFFAHFFGTSAPADAFNAAFRIPNLLQNLLGEGVLSASFIPEYAGLRAQGKPGEAARLAIAVGALLALASAVVVLLGVFFAPQLVGLIAGGFEPATRELTTALVRILFPGAALLAFSAWCLAILNSHGRFFLSYAAPVLWNAALIATLIWFGPSTSQPQLAEFLAWGSVAGSALQFLAQLPWVVGYLRAGGWRGSPAANALGRVVHNFGPVVIGRGAVQISAYIDTRIASAVATGAMAAVVYAQMLYLLPVSLFAMSVSAAELPAMSRVVGAGDEVRAGVRARIAVGLRRIAFFVVPSAVALIVLGDVIAGAIYQRGEFTRSDTVWVWQLLAAAGLGLLASTLARLYASAFYALRDTRTPLKFALVRIVLSAGLGYALAVPVPRALGIDPRLGAAGLMLAGALASWLELALLRRAIASRVGVADVGGRYIATLIGIAGVAAALAVAVKIPLGGIHPIPLGVIVLGIYGITYLGATFFAAVPEARALAARLPRRFG